MANTPSLPVSLLIASKSQSVGSEPQKKTREDWRKAKELEEARKAGTAPAAVDEEGKDINPHIPQYISSAPWYYNTVGPTLKHQRPQEDDKQKQLAKVGDWFQRGVNLDSLTTKFRKGACENCGAVTHKKKDCMERPRKVLAKFSGAEIAPDEFIQPDLKLDFDGKRDRWNGYNPTEHLGIIEEFEKVEDTKRQLKAQRLNTGDEDEGGEEEMDGDEDKYVDEVDMPGTKVDSKQRITVRNLRIREDTAKYLRNLDPNSAYYDPKTRSMRENPYKDTGKEAEQVDYAGENFIRFSGDTSKHAQAQLFAWEAQHAGVDVHLLAEPTKAEKLKVEYVGKKEEIKSSIQESILERYGGKEHLQVPPKALLLAQTEQYVEYSRAGKIIKGAEKPVVSSRYEEDVYINNHQSVWGSYWKDGQWGFQCCYSMIKNSYCTGERSKDIEEEKIPSSTVAINANKIVTQDSDDGNTDSHDDSQEEKFEEKQLPPPEVVKDTKDYEKSEARRKKKRDKKKKKKSHKKSVGKKGDTHESSDSESDEEAEKKKKLLEALQAEEKRLRQVDRLMSLDERKRPYNSMVESKAPNEEELEAYYMKRKREEDPMAFF
ncbi:pre-mRNA-splicing factor SLU7-like [Daphnia pulicaria]|uniref:pre-mRNA-splicing factor SLU7-like n=1 Tax=Daphnia pulicaria TaxID=35523 RepID=UPI001EE9C337|nr:pre-mRNA-splicing factor SLU7-like [Daphnia pulicaria]